MSSVLSLPSVGSGSGLPGPVQNQAALVSVVGQIQTNNAEQLQARSVEQAQGEGVKPEGGDIGDPNSHAKLEALLQYRSTQAGAETWSDKMADRANQEWADQTRATAAYRQSQVSSTPPVRDAGADDHIVSLDIAA